MHRSTGFKLGGFLILVSLLYLSQTSLSIFMPHYLLLSEILNFSVPTIIYGFNLVVISWIMFAIGLLSFILAVLDIYPFNY